MKVLKRSKEEARQQALKYLEKVGMAPYINAKPRQISGGQKQRAVSYTHLFLKKWETFLTEICAFVQSAS